MVGFILDLKPIAVKELQERLRRQSDIANRRIAISRSMGNRILEDPTPRNKFQID